MTRKIFKSDQLQKQFEQYGFVKLPLLEAEEIDFLKDFYLKQEFDNKIESGFHISLDNQDEDLVKDVGTKIQEILEPKTSDFLDDCQIFTASYVIKEPGLKNIVPPHQDWTFVDEREFCSLTVWTPLQDVNEENGGLGVIPGSHRLFDHPRSSPSPQSRSPLSDHIFTLFPYVQMIDLKAGETLIFDNRLIHASPPNLTDKARLAVGIGITHKEAGLKHYYQNPQKTEEELIEYDVDPSFYTYFNNKRLSDLFDGGQLPELQESKRIVRDVPNFSVDEMKKLIEALPGSTYNQELMNKLAKLFNYDPNATQLKKEEEHPITKGEVEEVDNTSTDARSFFQKYSPGNVVREIIWRLKGRPETADQ